MSEYAMRRRLTAWAIFLGFIALLGMGPTFGVGNRAFQYGIWAFWLFLVASFLWTYAHTRSLIRRKADGFSGWRAPR
jgi:hypothetical protein